MCAPLFVAAALAGRRPGEGPGGVQQTKVQFDRRARMTRTDVRSEESNNQHAVNRVCSTFYCVFVGELTYNLQG